MSVIRINKTKDYTVMSNYHFRDRRLSLKAKGLLSQMLSLPANWDYTITGLVAINKENESAVKTALAELKVCGYLKVTKLMPDKTESGRIEYIYDIYEKPLSLEKQPQEKQGIENLGLENPGQYNTKELNTDNKVHKDKINKENSAKRFKAPTIKEVTEYCLERQNTVNPEQFVDFYASKGWKVGNTPMKDWKAAVRTWEQRATEKNKPADKRFYKPETVDNDLPF